MARLGKALRTAWGFSALGAGWVAPCLAAEGASPGDFPWGWAVACALLALGCGVLLDVLARTRARARMFARLLDTVENLSVQGYRADGTVFYWNDASQTVYGHTREEALGRNLTDLIIPPAMREEVRAAVAGMVETGVPLPAAELTLMRRDGSPVTVYSTHAVLDHEGKAVLFCLDVDLGALKHVENALRRSEERYRLIMEHAGDALYVCRADGTLVEANTEAQRQTGFTRAEILAMGVGGLDAIHSPERMEEVFRQLRETGRLHMESLHRRKDGGVFPVDLRLALIEAFDGPLIMGLARDMSCQKQAEDLLTRANTTLATVLNSVPADVNVVDLETLEILFINESMKRAFGRDCTGDICFRCFRGRTTPCETCDLSRLLTPEGEPGDSHAWVDPNPLTGKWYLNHDRVVRWIDGRLARIQIAMDITERRQAQQRTEDSLKEKEILLREIHHRVKNNLQIISSLLSLQEQGVQNTEALALLAESRGRVASMAMIHEQLYQSGDFARLDMHGYVGKLAQSIVGAFRGDRAMRVLLSTQPVPLTLEQAVPLGLILNELITNALKHGLAGRTQGSVEVRIGIDGDTVRAEVVDDGRGLPPGFDPEAVESLGLQLVRTLAGQLGGSLTARAVGGGRTAFEVVFPLGRG